MCAVAHGTLSQIRTDSLSCEAPVTPCVSTVPARRAQGRPGYRCATERVSRAGTQPEAHWRYSIVGVHAGQHRPHQRTSAAVKINGRVRARAGGSGGRPVAAIGRSTFPTGHPERMWLGRNDARPACVNGWQVGRNYVCTHSFPDATPNGQRDSSGGLSAVFQGNRPRGTQRAADVRHDSTHPRSLSSGSGPQGHGRLSTVVEVR